MSRVLSPISNVEEEAPRQKLPISPSWGRCQVVAKRAGQRGARRNEALVALAHHCLAMPAPSKLKAYRAKREFSKTPEPAGGPVAAEGNRFVVHKHHATA